MTAPAKGGGGAGAPPIPPSTLQQKAERPQRSVNRPVPAPPALGDATTAQQKHTLTVRGAKRRKVERTVDSQSVFSNRAVSVSVSVSVSASVSVSVSVNLNPKLR